MRWLSRRKNRYGLCLDLGLNRKCTRFPVEEEPGVISDGLIAWWKHDEGSGTALNDYEGDYDGVIRGANFWNNTAPDGSPCGTYDGLNNDVNAIGTGLAFTGGQSISMVAGVRFDESPFTANRCVLARATKDGGTALANYRLIGSDGGSDLRFVYHDTGGVGHTYGTTNFGVVADTWYIVTLVYTFGTGSTLKIYRNTTLCSGSWSAGDGDDAPTTVTAYFHIGSWDDSNPRDDSGIKIPMKGQMGDILIYNVALSEADVVVNYNALKTRYGL